MNVEILERIDPFVEILRVVNRKQTFVARRRDAEHELVFLVYTKGSEQTKQTQNNNKRKRNKTQSTTSPPQVHLSADDPKKLRSLHQQHPTLRCTVVSTICHTKNLLSRHRSFGFVFVKERSRTPTPLITANSGRSSKRQSICFAMSRTGRSLCDPLGLV